MMTAATVTSVVRRCSIATDADVWGWDAVVPIAED